MFVLTPFGAPKQPEQTLRITVPEDLDFAGVFDEVVGRYASHSELVEVRTVDMGSLFQLEYVLQMREAGTEKRMIDELRCLNGNLKISLGHAAKSKEAL